MPLPEILPPLAESAPQPLPAWSFGIHAQGGDGFAWLLVSNERSTMAAVLTADELDELSEMTRLAAAEIRADMAGSNVIPIWKGRK